MEGGINEQVLERTVHTGERGRSACPASFECVLRASICVSASSQRLAWVGLVVGYELVSAQTVDSLSASAFRECKTCRSRGKFAEFATQAHGRAIHVPFTYGTD